jgi:hypothetical protein
MASKTKITVQETNELQTFIRHLKARRITTPELKSVLMILRQHCNKGSALREWADSIAHNKRDQGSTCEAGIELWKEKFEINAYFSTGAPQLRKVPIRIFDRLLGLFEDDEFDFGGIDMKRRFPGGYSKREILASIRFMYAKDEKKGVYRLIPAPDKNVEDLRLMLHFISQLEHSDWGGTPYRFEGIQAQIADALKDLIGPVRRIIDKNGDLLAMHFIAAFHLTEVDLKLPRRSPNSRCFLSLDSTSLGHLCLSLGLYRREKGVWDAVELAQPDRSARFAGSHDYTRPFLLTDLKETDHFWSGNGSEMSFRTAITVTAPRNGKCLLKPVDANVLRKITSVLGCAQ